MLLQDQVVTRFTYPSFDLLRTHSRLLSGVVGIMFLPRASEITDHGRSFAVPLQVVSHDYFQVLGIQAQRGRVFDSADTMAVISDRYWRAHYNSSPDAIGDHFHWSDWEFTVIGVAPAGFHGVMLDRPADIFIPLETAVPPVSSLRTRGRLVSLVARMKPGVTPRQVAAEAGAMLHRSIQVEAGGTGISTLRDQIARPLVVLDFLVAFVLLIACSNLANLVLASGASRQREMAVRQAIGAGRSRLVCQLLTENALLALAGGALAILVAQWISRSLLLFLPPNATDILPNLSFRPDLHVLAFTGALVAAACLLFGLAPAFQATRSAPLAGLRQTPGAGATSTGWLSRGLVISEVGLCTAVLMTAGLFTRTLHNLQGLDPAAAPQRIVVADLPTPKGFSPAERLSAFDALRQRAAAIPGVRAAGYVYIRPLTGHGLNFEIHIPGATEEQSPLYDCISPGFLSAVGIPLVEGREFTERDDANAAPVAIVNELFARRFLPGTRAAGRRFRITGDTRDIEIVGVVKDTRWMSLREPPAPMFYRPFRQDPQPFATIAVRTTGDPDSLAATLGGLARGMQPPLPSRRYRCPSQNWRIAPCLSSA